MYMSSKRVNDLLVGLCLGISFMVRNEMIPFVNKDDSYYIMTFIIALAFIKWMINGFHINIKNRRNILEIGMQYSVIPKIIIYVYSIVIILAGLSEMRYLSSNIQTFINGLSAIAAFYLLDESIFKVSAYAVVVGYFGNIIIRIFNGTLFSKSFEYHDLAFSVGYIVIFIVMTKNKWTYKKLFIYLAVLVMILLAGKRIGIFSLVISIIWLFFVTRQSEKNQKCLITITGVVMMLVCYLLVYLVLNPDWNLIESNLNIDLAGRNYYYAAMQNYAHFGTDFIGLGRNACQVILKEDFPYFRVGNVHSDILRMYVESGFWMFSVWLIYYLIIMPKYIERKIGTKSSKFVMAVTLYTFIVYMTDNTELYLMNQFFYILTLLLFMNRELKGEYIK